MRKLRHIQFLRGMAVASVILFHLPNLSSNGYLGVDIFFVISGYVITTSFLRAQTGFPLGDAWAFMKRRVRRILPALLWCIVVTGIFSGFFLSKFDLLKPALWTGLAASVGLGNIAIALLSGDYFLSSAAKNPYLHTWSLGVEEQFYLVFCVLIAFGSFRQNLKTKIAQITVLSLIGLSLGAFFVFSSGLAVEGFQTLFGFYSPITRAWEILVGVFLASRSFERIDPFISPRHSRVWATGSLAVLAAILAGPPSLFGGPALLTCIAITASAIFIVNGESLPFQTFIGRAGHWLGDHSYSAYLWHWPVIYFAEIFLDSASFIAVITLVLTPLLATLSKKYVEAPWIDGGRIPRASKILGILGLATSFSVLLGSLVLAFTIDFGSEGQENRSRLEDLVPCTDLGNFQSFCTFNASSTQELLVVGDSTALPYFDSALERATALGYSLRFSSKNGCPAIRPARRYPRGDSCQFWQEEVSRHIEERKPEEVWIINRGGAYTNPKLNFYGLVDEDGRKATSDSQIQLIWRDALEYIVNLSPESNFVIFHSGPELPMEPDVRTLFRYLIQNEKVPLEEHASIDRSLADEQRTNALYAERSLLTRASGVIVMVDPFEALCPSGVCLSRDGNGGQLYWDRYHLSKVGADLVFDIEIFPKLQSIGN